MTEQQVRQVVVEMLSEYNARVTATMERADAILGEIREASTTTRAALELVHAQGQASQKSIDEYQTKLSIIEDRFMAVNNPTKQVNEEIGNGMA